jgi:hypothetical protein
LNTLTSKRKHAKLNLTNASKDRFLFLNSSHHPQNMLMR